MSENARNFTIAIVAVILITGGVLFTLNSGEKKENNERSSNNDNNPNTSSPSTSSSGTENSVSYRDGSYSATGSYVSPAGEEEIGVSLTIEDGNVVGVEIATRAEDQKSIKYQEDFAENVDSEVINVAVNDIDLDKVSGSSLTPEGFNEALEVIKNEAAVSEA